MKKLFFLLPFLALFVACQSTDPVEAGRITFSNQQVEDLTRGDNTITTANLANFDVWGHNDNGVVFNGVKVEKQGDEWACTEEKMWEENQTYHFHAFAPAGVVSNVGEYPDTERAKGLGNFAYTNAGDKDLIYAYATRTQGSLFKINTDPVQLAFEHLLSRVEFTFKNNFSEGNVTISNVQITEVAKSAELNCGDVDMANWEWTATSTGSYSFGGTTTIAKGASASTENVQFLFPAATRNYDITFSIAYESDPAEERTATVLDVNLVMGKSYNINVTIEDKDVVTEQYKIEFFVAEVKDWGSDIELDATINEKTENPETPDVSSEMENGHEWVDLGLPSGLKWATCNVGATTPEGCGDYFAWGEVEPKTTYNWITYKYCVDDEDNLTKYSINSTYGDYGKDGFIDNKTILDPEDDAATVNWGGAWRMPTTAEQQELIDNCTWDWTTQNGVEGHKVTGPNGNSIFLPLTGYMFEGTLYDDWKDCYFWSSSLICTDTSHHRPTEHYPHCAYNLHIGTNGPYCWTDFSRCFGLSVRPVCQ
ncbi:MAG: fimbrillin family protein [Paludibacteraceae bacterium]|nr:fimbrillin family protein [Paludibacteraceae bacterium]